MFIALGATAYLWYTTISNGGKIDSSSLIIVGIITIFSLIYFGIVSWIVRRLKKEHSVLMNKLDQISGEFLRATDLILRSKNWLFITSNYILMI